jgi:hypothetical protein
LYIQKPRSSCEKKQKSAKKAKVSSAEATAPAPTYRELADQEVSEEFNEGLPFFLSEAKEFFRIILHEN